MTTIYSRRATFPSLLQVIDSQHGQHTQIHGGLYLGIVLEYWISRVIIVVSLPLSEVNAEASEIVEDWACRKLNKGS